ncbi:serine-type D-Ala-D-Ala carboxypeptidase [Vibrio sp. NTOU-M3]|uniref:serine-type D-Ala-D-Ala carboxypeptidase n=1 Tax=Vibrio sp. NTOU-M3 TaxID=3234954 RepID=UPI00349F9BE4
MRYQLRSTLLVTLSALSLQVSATSPIDKLPQGSRVNLLIQDLNNRNLSHSTGNTDQFFPPASTLKVVTALAAKLELGDEFHYQTELSKVGNDLVIKFSGDPTLTTDDLANMLKMAKENGLKSISGDIWLDNSAFTGYDRAVGWPWDILGVCYSAPASAITLDKNCAQASIYTKDNGQTRVFVPQHYPIHVTTSAQTVTKAGQESTQCDLELVTTPDNHYELQGCLVSRSKPLPLKFAIQNPALYAQRMIYTQLNRLDIDLHGEVKIGTPEGRRYKTLAIHRSAALPQLLDIMLKKSDNLIADSLTRTIGAQFYIQPGSFKNGTQAIKQVIFANTGIDLEQAQMADGSGLSRNNRFNSKDMAAILQYIWQNDNRLHLIEHLPTSGQNGTLQYRSSMRKSPIKGQLIAKSGSLYGSYNMAGYGLDQTGKPSSLFVQFVTDYHPKKQSNAKPVAAPIVQFETLFYQDVIKFSQTISKK